ncbi:hypothetical protein A3A75_00595 [Candidatus Woesebacteria bacterium RIFCSPLOWO2_01_FULL_39_10]|uniref:Uncharacterized protein n=1 Tax=Candidatus Woesebacteria bacterium RIFCSPLOWO2_01_FULL_39_10 TaxID=1802516 RepID=A0A1F8B340_9BACT|nr:MAG: hypothetical protein A3A75_00595 [Candidatus Woesebacteria bacterium RIFCSPLOWO2_01_FULL_39_10]
MTVRITKWAPDTCECIVEYSWDDSVSEKQRVHTFVRIVRKGPEHAHLSDKAAYEAMLDENLSRGRLLDAILTDPKFAPHVGDVSEAATGQTTKGSLPGHRPVVSYDSVFSGTGRRLRVSVPLMNLAEREVLQKLADSLLSAGKVVVTG